ncbi:hypothetical protein EHM76_04685 [bacterium]|nr:MAG: hypothetical protein EHM76_04685 [bacterium]
MTEPGNLLVRTGHGVPPAHPGAFRGRSPRSKSSIMKGVQISRLRLREPRSGLTTSGTAAHAVDASTSVTPAPVASNDWLGGGLA